MGITQKTIPGKIGTTLSIDTSVGLTAQTLSTSGVTLYALTVDATANTEQAVYFKAWDVSAAPTVNTDAPSFQWKVPAGKRVGLKIPLGLAFANGFHYAVSQEPGVSTSSAPSGTVKVYTVT